MDDLGRLRDDVVACTRCPLAQERTNALPGEGAAGARLLLVAEAPTHAADRAGEAWQGPAMELLADALEEAGIARDDVALTHLVRCRPSGSREAREDEVEACRAHLEREVALRQPRVVAPLGSLPTRVLAHGLPLTRVHGLARPAALAGVDVALLPVTAPGAALHVPALHDALRADLAAAAALLGIGAPPPPTPAPLLDAPETPAGAQLDLFG
jgi:DNA polymerase